MPDTKFKPGKWQSGGIALDQTSTSTSQASQTQTSQTTTTCSSFYGDPRATSLNLSVTGSSSTNTSKEQRLRVVVWRYDEMWAENEGCWEDEAPGKRKFVVVINCRAKFDRHVSPECFLISKIRHQVVDISWPFYAIPYLDLQWLVP